MKAKQITIIPVDRNKTIVQFMAEAPAKDFEWFQDKELALTVKEYKKHRSLDANAMYWKLIGELGKVLHVSNAALHNTILSRYGVFEEVDGQLCYAMIRDTDEAFKRISESEFYHLKATSEVVSGKDGDYRKYIMLKGSHEYNTAEFSRLLNGLVDECRMMGIQTESDDEIAHIMELYKGAK